MLPRGLARQFAETFVKRDKYATLDYRCLEDVDVGATGQPFLERGVDIMSHSSENGGGARPEILVEFELHEPEGSGMISSRANIAP